MLKFDRLYQKAIQIAYKHIVDLEISNAKLAKSKFIAIDFERFIAEYGKSRLKIELKNFLSKLLFFRDSEVLSKLEEIGLGETELCWFIPLRDINSQFDVIQAKGIKIDKPKILTYIRLYSQFKFMKALLLWDTKAAIHDHVRMPQLTKDLIDINNRRKYSGGDPQTFKGIYDFKLNRLLKYIDNNPVKPDLDIKIFLKITKGATESIFIKSLLEDCFSYHRKKISETQFLSIVYDLFRLILQEHYLQDEDAFDEKRDMSQKNFSRFKAKRLKKIIYKR